MSDQNCINKWLGEDLKVTAINNVLQEMGTVTESNCREYPVELDHSMLYDHSISSIISKHQHKLNINNKLNFQLAVT